MINYFKKIERKITNRYLIYASLSLSIGLLLIAFRLFGTQILMHLLIELSGIFFGVFVAITYVENYNKRHLIVKNEKTYNKLINNFINLLGKFWLYFPGDLLRLDMSTINMLAETEQPLENIINLIEELKTNLSLIKNNSENDPNYFGYKNKSFHDLLKCWLHDTNPLIQETISLKQEIQIISGNDYVIIELLSDFEDSAKDLKSCILKSEGEDIYNLAMFLDKIKLLLEAIKNF